MGSKGSTNDRRHRIEYEEDGDRNWNQSRSACRTSLYRMEHSELAPLRPGIKNQFPREDTLRPRQLRGRAEETCRQVTSSLRDAEVYLLVKVRWPRSAEARI